jgi:hypothetical protein
MFARGVILLVGLAVASAGDVAAEESPTAPLARKLTAFMNERGLDSVAAHLGPGDQRFVAALYLPNQMLIVISADYSAPTLLKEKILLERFREAYLDLSGATIPASRLVIQDLGADGLRARADAGQSVDVYTRGDESPFVLDGDWKRRKLREDDYRAMVTEATSQYERMLKALLAEASDESQ